MNSRTLLWGGVRPFMQSLPASHRRRLSATQLKSAVAKGILSETTPQTTMPARPTTKRPQRGAAAPQAANIQTVPLSTHRSLILEATKIQEALLSKSEEYVDCREKLTQIDADMQQLREDLRKNQTDLAQYVEKLPGGRQQDG